MLRWRQRDILMALRYIVIWMKPEFLPFPLATDSLRSENDLLGEYGKPGMADGSICAICDIVSDIQK